jgi:tRNA (mo5U34)-methyltransferase
MFQTLLSLKPYRKQISISPLASDIRSAWLLLRRSQHWAPLAHAISRDLKHIAYSSYISTTGPIIEFSIPQGLASRGFEGLLKRLSPWRIGPYKLGEIVIDSEWNSDLKWQRIAPFLGDIKGKIIGDVGCNSGYFLFRAAALQPELMVGFDPVERCWLQFALLHGLSHLSNLAFVPTGIANLDAFTGFFDLLLCMGVIYHQRDPFMACKKLFSALKPGGRVILESLVIPQEGAYLLVPSERYAKMRNAWLVPTPGALVNLLLRAGFKDPQLSSFGAVTVHEQRRTEWAPYESLLDFLDPHDTTKTIEGYPAPHTALVVAQKE